MFENEDKQIMQVIQLQLAIIFVRVRSLRMKVWLVVLGS